MPYATNGAINSTRESQDTLLDHADSDSELETSTKPTSAAFDGSVSWMSLPRKDQLFILFLCRLVDFLQFASLQAYVFYQLKSIDKSLTDAEVSRQAGLLQACFTGAQVMTAMLWGKAADTAWCGRKLVVMIGLGGTALSCVGYGFATTFFWAAFWRAFGGAVNGTVGVVRTMLSENIKERKFQSRAFLILPMSFNVAGVLGPTMGGILANSATTLPGIFGEGAILGFRWVHTYPYALPSLLIACNLSAVTVIVFLFLEETSKLKADRSDVGLILGRRIKAAIFGRNNHDGYERVPAPSFHMDSMANSRSKSLNAPSRLVVMCRLPFRRIWTRNVIFTLITTAFFDFNLGAFSNIWSLFLSTPRYDDSPSTGAPKVRRGNLLMFSGGLGMPASTVGIATSFLGLIGMVLQLTLYPPIQSRLGTIRSFRYFLPLFAVCYFITPYLAILPSSSAPTAPASGAFVWIGIIFVLFLQVTARTFTMPASIILLNNCSPHPTVLGTVHGLGQSVSAAFRTVGPVVGGWWYGHGLEIGMVAWGWWGVAMVSALAGVTALGMHEGSGHEVLLDDEYEEEEI